MSCNIDYSWNELRHLEKRPMCPILKKKKQKVNEEKGWVMLALKPEQGPRGI